MIKVLLVDDEKLALEYLEHIIDWEYHGFELIGVTTNPEQALAIYKTHRPDLVISDVKMPGLNGFDVLEYFKTNNLFSLIPVSIITSDTTQETRNRVFSYGVVDILVKPFNERDIKQVLDKTIYFNDQL